MSSQKEDQEKTPGVGEDGGPGRDAAGRDGGLLVQVSSCSWSNSISPGADVLGSLLPKLAASVPNMVLPKG